MMPLSSGDHPMIELQGRPSLMSALRRFWFVVLVSVVGFALGAYGLSSLQEETYRATGTIFLADAESSPVGGGSNVDEVRYVRNQAGLLESREVAERVSDNVRGVSPREVLRRVDATPSAETDVVTLTAEAADPDQAVLLANQAVAAYRDVIDERLRQSASELSEARERLEQEVADLDARLAAGGDPTVLEFRRASLVEEIVDLRSRESQLAVSTALSSGVVRLYEEAQTPQEPVSPRPLRTGVVGALAGALVGALLAWSLASRRPLIESPELPALHLAAPLLGEIGRRRSHRTRMEVQREEDGLYQSLVPVLDRVLRDADHRVVLVTGTRGGGHSAEVAARLAAAAAEDGRRVLLVDSDLRTRRLTKELGAQGAPGLADLEAESELAHLTQTARLTPTAAFSFLPAGTLTSPVAGSVRSRHLAQGWDRLGDDRAVAIVACPPLASSAEASMLAQEAAGVIVVVPSETPAQVIDELRTKLHLLDARAIGYVFDHRAGRRAGDAGRLHAHPVARAGAAPAATPAAPTPASSAPTPPARPGGAAAVTTASGDDARRLAPSRPGKR